jgi:hypothetical protein
MTSLMRWVDAHLLLQSTNEVLSLGFSNLNNLTRLLLSLALQCVSLAEQMGKRSSMDKLGMYLYSPHKKLAVGGKSTSLWVHWTLYNVSTDMSGALK